MIIVIPSIIATVFILGCVFSVPRRKCIGCGFVDDPHEMFMHADGRLYCKICHQH